MAKKAARSGVNKSQAIRDFAAQNNSSSPKEIVAGLAAQGIEVSSQFVSTILSNAKRKGKKGRRGRRGRPAANAAAAPANTGGGVSMKNLIAAKRFVDQFGSVKEAKAAVNAIADLLG